MAILRSVVFGLAAFALYPDAWAADSAVAYTLSVDRSQAVLGQPITVTLRGRARASTKALDFDHASLVLSAARRGSTEEPWIAIPNVGARQDGNLVVRVQSGAREKPLKTGQQFQRSFDLIHLFPQLLDLGEFDISYRLEDAVPVVRVSPIRIRITSSPSSVPYLQALLGDKELSLRSRAAGLLHRMTGQGMDFDAAATDAERNRAAQEWALWWTAVGSKLRWDPAARGAGGVSYPQASLSDAHRVAFLNILNDWMKKPALAALRGDRLVGDREIQYPRGPALIGADPEMIRALRDALARVGSMPAESGSDHSAEALLLVTTAAVMPAPEWKSPLSILASLKDGPSWNPVQRAASGLLDWIDNDRVPVGPLAGRRQP